MAARNATDGQIESLKLRGLVDDRGYLSAVRGGAGGEGGGAGEVPEARGGADGVGGRISVGVMRRMNYEVDGEHRGRAEVVTALRSRL